MTPHARASLAHEIATGRPLPADAEAVTWALACLSTAHASSAQHRAAVVVAEYLDSLPLDDDTRRRLGLEPKAEPVAETWPAWVRFGAMCVMYLTREDEDSNTVCEIASVRDDHGWKCYPSPLGLEACASGPETGEAGRLAAEAALRRAGVLPEGATVRRAGGGA